jgi:hypothetical protein
MVGTNGQTMTEFLLMLGLLTLVGAILAKTLVGPDQSSGAIGTMQTIAAQKIANDQD